MPAHNLINQKFGKLLVIKRIYLSVEERKLSKNNEARWECQCDCGNKIILASRKLTRSNIVSCGCIPKFRSVEEATFRSLWWKHYFEMKFEDYFTLSKQNCLYCKSPPTLKIKAISYREGEKYFYYNTLDRIDSTQDHNINNVVPCCFICNSAKLTKTFDEFKKYILYLINNPIISPEKCRNKSKNIDASIIHQKENYPLRGSIKKVLWEYRDGNLSLDEFYQLTTLDCFYCGIPGQNKVNAYSCRKSASQYAKNNGDFIYNGLDRIDNNLKHAYSNVVPCCKYCNVAKNNKTLDEFYSWIDRLKANYCDI